MADLGEEKTTLFKSGKYSLITKISDDKNQSVTSSVYNPFLIAGETFRDQFMNYTEASSIKDLMTSEHR